MDLYTDYLISNFGQATATGLAKVSANAVSHDKITRLLSSNNFTSKDLCLKVKGLVRKYEREDSCLIFDDTTIKKPYTDENEITAWHWDSLLRLFCYISFCDLKTHREKRKCPLTKNEMMRSIIQVSLHNNLKFKYILADSCLASIDNIKFVSQSPKKFIFDLKMNRLKV